MTAASDLLATLRSLPSDGRNDHFRGFRERGEDLHAAAWDEPEVLLDIASALDALDESAGADLAELTQDRARETLRGSTQAIDFRFAVAYARACKASGRASDANEALSAVYYSEHRALAEPLVDDVWHAWAAHAPLQAPFVDVDGQVRLDAPSADGDAHDHLILTVSAMTMNGVTEHAVMVNGAREVAKLKDADIEALAVRAGSPASLSGATLKSPHEDADVALQAVLLEGRRARLEHVANLFAEALVAAFQASDTGAVSQGLLEGDLTATCWFKQAVVSRRNDGGLAFNASWLDVVRARLPEGYGLDAAYGQDTPLGPEALVLQATDGVRTVLMVLDDIGQFGATPIE